MLWRKDADNQQNCLVLFSCPWPPFKLEGKMPIGLFLFDRYWNDPRINIWKPPPPQPRTYLRLLRFHWIMIMINFIIIVRRPTSGAILGACSKAARCRGRWHSRHVVIPLLRQTSRSEQSRGIVLLPPWLPTRPGWQTDDEQSYSTGALLIL